MIESSKLHEGPLTLAELNHSMGPDPFEVRTTYASVHRFVQRLGSDFHNVWAKNNLNEVQMKYIQSVLWRVPIPTVYAHRLETGGIAVLTQRDFLAALVTALAVFGSEERVLARRIEESQIMFVTFPADLERIDVETYIGMLVGSARDSQRHYYG